MAGIIEIPDSFVLSERINYGVRGKTKKKKKKEAEKHA